jgi:DNA-directed RNA polymerase subunit RPC12/RpoP
MEEDYDNFETGIQCPKCKIGKMEYLKNLDDMVLHHPDYSTGYVCTNCEQLSPTFPVLHCPNKDCLYDT